MRHQLQKALITNVSSAVRITDAMTPATARPTSVASADMPRIVRPCWAWKVSQIAPR
jgi:hypothetical protein